MRILKTAALESLTVLCITGVTVHAQARTDTLPPVRIENVRTTEPNSAGGVNVRLAWRNLSPTKTVKYAHFEVVPFNAVDDSVASEIGNKVRARLQDTGPVKPGEWSGSPGKVSEAPDRYDYNEWENVWYNSTIVRVEVRRVTIDYTDGTHSTLQGKLLKKALHCTPGLELTDEAENGFCERAAH